MSHVFTPKPSQIHGTGLFTLTCLSGHIEFQMPGTFTDDSRVWHMCFEYNKTMGFLPDSPFLFMNHSRSPNCEVYAVNRRDDFDNKDYTVYILRTLRNIGKGEEILIDYGYDPV